MASKQTEALSDMRNGKVWLSVQDQKVHTLAFRY